MALNADKPLLWKADVAASVDLFNAWFLENAPAEYRRTRQKTTGHVEEALQRTGDLARLTPEILRAHPGVLPTLRASTAPPLARDRLIGLSQVAPGLVAAMERGALPAHASQPQLQASLERICATLDKVLDRGLFPWLSEGRAATEAERTRSAMVVADRLCGALSDPIIRNAHEARQLAVLEAFLVGRGYRRQPHPPGTPLGEMEAGTFCFRLTVAVRRADNTSVNMPIDAVVQPRSARPGAASGGLPILIEAKSAGDFANTNKRRKEEATKIAQLRLAYGPRASLTLFLCGYFDAGYWGYSAHEGLDWVWEHRVEDLLQLGL